VLLLLFGGYARRRAASLPETGSGAEVSHAGTVTANGAYIHMGEEGGKPYYNLEGEADDFTRSSIYWDGDFFSWRLTGNIGQTLYLASDDTAFPWEAASWTEVDGLVPAPTVAEA
jgi:hypothetical protein